MLIGRILSIKFVIGHAAPEVGLVQLGNTEQTLLWYAMEPELAEAAAGYNLAISNGQDQYYIRDGIQAILWGQDHSYRSGPMVSPSMFRHLPSPYTSRGSATLKIRWGSMSSSMPAVTTGSFWTCSVEVVSMFISCSSQRRNGISRK